MRYLLPALAFAALGACAATSRAPADPYTAAYNVDANAMVRIVMDATQSQHMHLAVVEQSNNFDNARFVIVPDDAAPGDHTALVIHLDQERGSDRFQTCFGACRSWVHVTPIGDGLEVQRRAAAMLTALDDRTTMARYAFATEAR